MPLPRRNVDRARISSTLTLILTLYINENEWHLTVEAAERHPATISDSKRTDPLLEHSRNLASLMSFAPFNGEATMDALFFGLDMSYGSSRIDRETDRTSFAPSFRPRDAIRVFFASPRGQYLFRRRAADRDRSRDDLKGAVST